MKTIIAGSRDGIPYEDVQNAISSSGFDITTVICGMARGVDTHGLTWANQHKVPVLKFKPDWSVGRHAGVLRNEDMACAADALILVWDGKSKGSSDMLKRAKKHNLKIFSHVIETEPQQLNLNLEDF